jgi:AAHS family 4-hydroxybenzoate transporter-like MFS transporter
MAKGEQVDVVALIESQKANWFRVSIVIWACAIMLMEGYDIQVLAYAAPSIIKAWHIKPSYFGPIFGFSLFGYMLGATVLSNFADRMGRKKIILGGIFLFGAFNLVTVYAHSLSVLLILRFLAGIGLGASIPSTIALTVEYFPTRARATIIGVLFTGYTVGAMAGGFIAASLIPKFGWPSVFYLGGAVPIALAVALFFTLPESVRFLALNGNQPDRVAAILAKLRPDLTIDRNTQFVVREEKHGGIPVQHLFTDGRASMTLLLWFAYVTSLLGHYFLTSWLPTLLVGAGVPLAHAVIAGGLLQGGGGVGGLLLCWLLDKRGIVPVAIAFALSAPLIVLIAFSTHVSDLLLLGLVFVTGICLVGGQTGLNGISGTFYPTYIRSTGTGWAFGVGRVGSILGPVVGGILISFNLPITLLFTCAALPALCCAGATYLLAPAAKLTPESPAVPSGSAV